MQVCRSAQGLSELRAASFAHVVDDGDGDLVLALHVAQQAEEAGDVGAGVLVEPMHSHEGVEQEHGGLDLRESGVEPLLIGVEVEAQAGRGDDVQIERVDIEVAVSAEALDASPDLGQGVLGEEDEGGSPSLYLEAIEARCARGDGDGDVEPEP